MVMKNKFAFMVPASKLKIYKAYAASKNLSLSALVFSVLQNEIGDNNTKTTTRIYLHPNNPENLFNAEQKIAFLKTLPSETVRKAAVRFFAKTAEHENNSSTEIAQWSDEKLIALFNDLAYLSRETTLQMLGMLRRYVKFCRTNNLPYSDAAFFVEI